MTTDRVRRTLLYVGVGALLAGAALTLKGLRRSGPGSAEQNAAQAGLRSVTVIDDPQPLPAFELASPAGPLTRDSLRGRWTFLFFGYTQCPDVCPTALSLMAELQRQLAPPQRPAVLFVSVDPQRDTHELLAAYVPAFDVTFRGASGSDAALAALVKHLGVMYQRHPPAQAEHPGIYTVDHTASMFLIDPQVRLRGVFSPPHDLAAMRADYLRLTGA
ncbi:SCO family protein [Sphaerotilus microaerophilus]|uniref:SCO family protein n=1 Tax=Sphaerotilus microaerophilus TaxID=2914710 RepID=A0ABM7YTM1_9BURK|nr:SCO family protein [Sphaerotilus sp. FB-5]BDI07961.1 SCO family protein [Sphaerotilus sp. FB-5]